MIYPNINIYDMKYIKSIYENNSINIVDKLVDYISTKSNVELYPYGGDIIVTRDNIVYNSKLYFTILGKAIRFNLSQNILISIDVWKQYIFGSTKADYTMELYNHKLNTLLNDVYLFFNDNLLINESTEDNFDIHKSFEEKVDYLVGTSPYRFTQLNMQSTKVLYDKKYKKDRLDVFKSIEYSVMQLSHNVSNFLLITGDDGFGKTTTVRSVLFELHKKYAYVNGDISDIELYKMLFKYRNDIILLDKCDNIIFRKNILNILNAATNPSKKRIISLTSNKSFDSTGMSDSEIEKQFEKTKQLPNSFTFSGSIIGITKLETENFHTNDSTKELLLNGLHVHVKLSKTEMLDRIVYVMDLMRTIDSSAKNDAYQYLVDITKSKQGMKYLNIQTYIHILNTRLANNFTTVIKGEKKIVWKLLVNEYLNL